MNGERRHWAENPKVVTGIYRALLVLCIGLVAVTPLAHHEGHFRWESWFGFYAGFGFVAYTFIVFAGKAVRKVLMRDEDYYDR